MSERRTGRALRPRIGRHVPLALAIWLGAFEVGAEPATAGTLNGGASVVYGAWLGSETEGINPYGLGVAASAGYTFGFGLHAGAAGHYFFGGSTTLPGNADLALDIRQLLGVAGFDLALGSRFVVRPEIAAGIAWTRGESCRALGCSSDSERHFALSPGGKLLYMLEPLHVAAELRYNRVFALVGDADGLLFGAGVGAGF